MIRIRIPKQDWTGTFLDIYLIFPYCNLRTVAAQLATVAPHLKNFEQLEKHFEWLVDGNISHLINKNLSKELRYLEMYLLHNNHQEVTSTIQRAALDSQELYYESGDTFYWVGILRAAEMMWKTTEEPALFRTEEEGINGSSPHIIVKGCNR